jgi:hypothetical protein
MQWRQRGHTRGTEPSLPSRPPERPERWLSLAGVVLGCGMGALAVGASIAVHRGAQVAATALIVALVASGGLWMLVLRPRRLRTATFTVTWLVAVLPVGAMAVIARHRQCVDARRDHAWVLLSTAQRKATGLEQLVAQTTVSVVQEANAEDYAWLLVTPTLDAHLQRVRVTERLKGLVERSGGVLGGAALLDPRRPMALP